MKNQRGKSKFEKAIAFSEMFIMVLATVAFTFILSGGFVSGLDQSAYTAYYELTQEKGLTTKISSADLATLKTMQNRGFITLEQYSQLSGEGLFKTAGTWGDVKTTLSSNYNLVYPSVSTPQPSTGHYLTYEGYTPLLGTEDLKENPVQTMTAQQAAPAPSAGNNPMQKAPPAATTTAEYITLKETVEIPGIGPANTIVGKDGKTVGYSSQKAGDNKIYDSSGKQIGNYDDKGNINMQSNGAGYNTFLGEIGAEHTIIGPLGQGLAWASAVLILVNTFSAFLPEKQKDMVQPLGLALAGGIMAGSAVRSVLDTWGGKFEESWGKGGTANTYASVAVGVIVAYYIFAKNYEKTKTKEESIEFKCMPWQAPKGGADCNKCNNNALMPCSEYRCKSLGQTCMLINKGTGLDRCIDSSPYDTTSPGIKPWKEALTQGYSYTDVRERPPGEGKEPGRMKIVAEGGGCLKAFTAFDFGIITTDTGEVTQPAQCKIDFNHTAKFDDMQYYLGDQNLYIENHTQTVSLPGTELLNTEFPEIKNDGEYTMYIRCKDGNGNENRDEFSVRFCIDKTPDLTAPIIKTTSIPSGSAVQYKVDNVSINVYTNEPAECRWSRKDAVSFANMDNNMSCSNNVWEMNAEFLYTCTTTLTAIKDKVENDFYFRCRDLASAQNTMQESYPFILYGTQPLDILKVGPNGTVGGSTSTVTATLNVQTDNGFQTGNSDCYYSTTSDKGFIKMFETGGNLHKQDLDLASGTYNYFFKCIDAGGNTAYNSTNFTIFVDKYEPVALRTYNYEGKLVIITDEESNCAYSTSSCNFDLSKKEGIDMPYGDSKAHYAEWKTSQNYYIKCSDKYDNQPNPSECSIVIRPYQLEIE